MGFEMFELPRFVMQFSLNLAKSFFRSDPTVLNSSLRVFLLLLQRMNANDPARHLSSYALSTTGVMAMVRGGQVRSRDLHSWFEACPPNAHVQIGRGNG